MLNIYLKLDLVSGNVSTERVTVHKSLAVLVDKNLTWKSHNHESIYYNPFYLDC